MPGFYCFTISAALEHPVKPQIISSKPKQRKNKYTLSSLTYLTMNFLRIKNVLLVLYNDEPLVHYQSIQTTPATPGNRNNAQLAGFKAKVKR